jgi:hypothetical protein
MAELFLEELRPAFVARPTADMGYDYFVGFENPDGGLNVSAVEVKATEQPVNGRYPLPKQRYRRLANTNIPVLLLVVDVKQNRLFYALPGPESSNGERESTTIPVSLTEVDDRTKSELRTQLSQSNAVAAGPVH